MQRSTLWQWRYLWTKLLFFKKNLNRSHHHITSEIRFSIRNLATHANTLHIHIPHTHQTWATFFPSSTTSSTETATQTCQMYSSILRVSTLLACYARVCLCSVNIRLWREREYVSEWETTQGTRKGPHREEKRREEEQQIQQSLLSSLSTTTNT